MPQADPSPPSNQDRSQVRSIARKSNKVAIATIQERSINFHWEADMALGEAEGDRLPAKIRRKFSKL